VYFPPPQNQKQQGPKPPKKCLHPNCLSILFIIAEPECLADYLLKYSQAGVGRGGEVNSRLTPLPLIR
jgi:hypothetical protein